MEPAEVKHRLLAERTGRKGIQRWRDRSSLPIKRNPIDFFHLLSGEQKLFRLLTEILRTVRNWCCYFCYCYYWWCTLVPLVISFCTRIPWRHNWMTESLLPDEEMRLYDFRWRARHPHSIYFPSSFLRSLFVFTEYSYTHWTDFCHGIRKKRRIIPGLLPSACQGTIHMAWVRHALAHQSFMNCPSDIP